jgi:hypothetical protein
MTAGVTRLQDQVLGWISPEATTLERSGVEAAVMTGAEAKIVTPVNGINQNLTV